MRSEREKMLAGESYDPLDRELVAARGRARDLCQDLSQSRESEQDLRRRILTDPNIVWLAVLNGLVGSTAAFGTDHDLMQRLLTVETRRKSQQTLALTPLGTLVTLAIYFSIGAGLFRRVPNTGRPTVVASRSRFSNSARCGWRRINRRRQGLRKSGQRRTIHASRAWAESCGSIASMSCRNS